MTSTFALTADSPTTSPGPMKNLRDKEADSFHTVLATILTTGLRDALDAGDHPRAIMFINRGFAEGTPQLGCELLRHAMTVVGTARTWTVQLTPLAHASRNPRP
jgi:hypothetical protein